MVSANSPKKLLAAADSGETSIESLPGFDTFWYTWVSVNADTHLIQ
jgi:hypothetical protein